MADTKFNDTGAVKLGCGRVFVWTVEHDFSVNNILNGNTGSYKLPADCMLLGGTVEVTHAGTAQNCAVGVTDNTDYFSDAVAMGALSGPTAAKDNATPSLNTGSSDYLILTPAADITDGTLKINAILAEIER